MNRDLRIQWYSRQDVLGNIIPLITAREVAFLVPMSLRQESGNYNVRCIKAHHSSFLLNNMSKYNFFERNYNLYHSIYLLEGMPMFSYNNLLRGEQQREFFLKYDSYVRGVDFVMDFDGDKTLPIMERVEAARSQTIAVCRILADCHVPYNIVFSGSKGFHVEVRGLPPTRNWKKHTIVFKELATRLVLSANGITPQVAAQLDESEIKKRLVSYSFDSSIYDVTRIWKVPYSYDVATDMIAYPLTPEELINFKMSDYTAEALMKKNHWGIGLKRQRGDVSGFLKLAQSLGVSLDEW